MLAPLAALALVLAAEVPGPAVTLPLAEYEKLRQLRERPSVTVVELLRVEGSFGKRDLAISFSGRASGTLPTVAVLGGDGFRLHSCEGDALVARTEDGPFALTPLAPRFKARCRVALDGSDRLAAQATRAVLEVASGVEDGELVASGGAGEREISVVRRLAGRAEELPPSVAGRYRVTLLPEETRFTYRLEVRNPNRGHRRFELALREAEHVESVNAPVAWDAEGGRYRFDLPPGECAIELEGRLTGAVFAPPVEATLQYLLVESHPLIRAEVASGAKRVGVGEVGLSARYRGAQAFLLEGKKDVSWKGVRLEALKTAGFAVPSLRQVFFLGADANARGEADVAVENQGAPALAVPMAGEPTFASVSGEPAFLTRDEKGRLFLPLAQGPQQVVVQDRRPFRARLGLAAASLDLPAIGVPASRARVELRYPAEWIPLYEELAPGARQHLLRRGEAILLLALLGLGERLLAALGLSRRRRWLLAGAVTLAAAFSSAVLWLGLALSAAPLAAWGAWAVLRRLSGLRLAAGLSAVAAVALLVVLGAMSLSGEAHAPARDDYANVGKAMMRSRLSALEDERKAEAPAAPAAAPGLSDNASYQGLPARIDLPAGARRTVFTRELLATDAPRRVFVLLADARLVTALGWGTALLALAVAALLRRDLVRGARAFAERFATAA